MLGTKSSARLARKSDTENNIIVADSRITDIEVRLDDASSMLTAAKADLASAAIDAMALIGELRATEGDTYRVQELSQQLRDLANYATLLATKSTTRRATKSGDASEDDDAYQARVAQELANNLATVSQYAREGDSYEDIMAALSNIGVDDIPTTVDYFGNIGGPDSARAIAYLVEINDALTKLKS